MNSHDLTREELSVLRTKSPFHGSAGVLLRRGVGDYRLDSFRAGEQVFSKGDVLVGLYLLLSGSVSLEGPLPGTVEPGQLFGDMPLLIPKESGDADTRHLTTATATEDSKAIFLPLAEVKRFLLEAKGQPIASLLLHLLTESLESLSEGALAPKSSAYLLAEVVEKWVLAQATGAMKHRPFHPMTVVINVPSKEIISLAQQLPGQELSVDQWKQAAKELLDRGVIDQSVSHGPGSWRINRWAMSEFLRSEIQHADLPS